MPTLRVSASFGLKQPNDPSNTFAGSVESHVSYAIEEDVVGLTKEQILKRAMDLAKDLDNGVKLAVAASLDVGFVQDGEIIRLTPVVVPTVPHTSAPASRPSGRPAPQRPSSGGGGGGQFAPPKADLTQQPVVMLRYYGDDAPPVAFYDCRSLKASGVYNERAADFRSVDKFTNKKGEQAHIPIWLHDKDGNPKTWEQHLLAMSEKDTAQAAPY